MDAFFSLSWTEQFLSNSSFVPSLLCCKDLLMIGKKVCKSISKILFSKPLFHYQTSDDPSNLIIINDLSSWMDKLDFEELSVEFSVLNLISLIKFWFTAVVTWICLTAECWFNKKRTVMMDSDSNIRNRSNIHCKYPVIVYLFWPQRSQPMLVMVSFHKNKYYIDSDFIVFNCAHSFQKSPKNYTGCPKMISSLWK